MPDHDAPAPRPGIQPGPPPGAHFGPPPGFAPGPPTGAEALRLLARRLWQGRGVILACLAAACACAWLVTWLMEPRYDSSARLMVDPPRQNVIDLAGVLISPEFGQESLQNEIEILRSTALLDRVSHRLGLATDPGFASAPGGVLGGLFEETGADSGTGAGTGAGTDAGRRARADRLARLRDRLRLRPVPGSRIIEIGYVDTDPDRAAAVVNALAAEYVAGQQALRREATRTAADWLATRVEAQRDRLEAAEEAVARARAGVALSAGQGIELTRQQLSEANAELTRARGEQARIAARRDQASAALAAALATGADLGTVSEFRAAPPLAALLAEADALVSQRALVAPKLAADHPALQRLDARIAETRARIEAEAARVVAALDTDLDAAGARVAALGTELRRLEALVFEQSRTEIRLRQLEREAEAGRALYESFLGRLKEITAQEDLVFAEARLLSPAEAPLGPDRLRPTLAALGVILSGLGLGAGIVLLRAHLDDRVQAAPDLARMTGVQVLATLPAAGPAALRALPALLRDTPDAPLPEAVRSLRTALFPGPAGRGPRVVMLTSSQPQEGKSTAAMMLALTCRQMGRSAVIVDCDLRRPALAGLLGPEDLSSAAPGLLAVLEGRAGVPAARHVDPETGLHVLMSRPSERAAPASPADLLASPRFRGLIADLSARYDLVLLDTPPVLALADARIVARQAEAVVYAVRWNHTSLGAVCAGLDALAADGAPVCGLVLTMARGVTGPGPAYPGRPPRQDPAHAAA